MSLPSSGPISMGQIAGELGYGTSDNTDLNRLDVRALAQNFGNPINLSDFYNANCNTFDLTVGDHPTQCGYSASGTIHGSIAPSVFRGVTVHSLYIDYGVSGPTPVVGFTTGVVVDVPFYGMLLRPSTGFAKPTLFLPKSSASTIFQGGNMFYLWNGAGSGVNWQGIPGQHVYPQLVFKF